MNETNTPEPSLEAQIAEANALLKKNQELHESILAAQNALKKDLDAATVASTGLVQLRESADASMASIAGFQQKLINEFTPNINAAATAASQASQASVEANRLALLNSDALIKQAERAGQVEGRLGDYETNLALLYDRCKLQLERIDELLPGAASAGLATAFESRKKTFVKPIEFWKWVTLGSMGALIFVALITVCSIWFHGVTPTYDEIFRRFILSLPLSGALIWLALVASNKYSLMQRVEEDYGYKETTAMSFMGFQRQFKEGTSQVDPESLEARLYHVMLNTLGSAPGAIYDKHPVVVSPLESLGNAASSIANSVTKPIG